VSDQEIEELLARVRSVESTGDPAAVGRAEAELAAAYHRRQHFHEALRWFQRALESFERDGLPPEIAVCAHRLGLALSTLDRYEEALEHLERGRRTFEQAGLLVESAECQHSIGRALDNLSRYEAALEHLQGARATFTESGLALETARCERSIANVLNNQGRHEEALEYLESGRRKIEEAGLLSEAADFDQILGEVLTNLHRYEEALEHLERAWQSLQREGLNSEIADCADTVGLVLNNLGRYEEALEYLQRGLELVDPFGLPVKVARIERTVGEVLRCLGRYEDSLEHLEQANVAFLEAGLPIEVARCDRRIGLALIKLERYEEAHDHLERALATFQDADLPVEAARCERLIAWTLPAGESEEMVGHLELARRAFQRAGLLDEAAVCEHGIGGVLINLGHSEEALEFLERARQCFVDAGLTVEVASCDRHIAGALYNLRQYEQALERVAPALAELDQRRYALRASHHREAWWSDYDDVLAIALWAASESADRELMAELIESARVQGVPALAERRSSAEFTEPALINQEPSPRSVVSTFRVTDVPNSVARGAIGLLPLTPPPPISVRRRSRLGETRRTLTPATERVSPHIAAIPLEAVLASVAGSDAVWWGNWVVRDELWWSLVQPEVAVEAGRADLIAGSPLALALGQLGEALPGEEEAGSPLRRVLTGPLCSQPAAERDLASCLGQALIPAKLRQLLLERLKGLRAGDPGVQPLSLVIAPAPELARVPFGLLAIAEADHPLATSTPTGNDPPRLIEAATLRFAPSAALLANLRPSGRRGAPGRVAVAVADPTSDLRYAEAPAGAERFLLGERLLAEVDGKDSAQARLATREELAAALRQSGGGRTEAVATLVGHARAAPDGLPGHASFVLADGELSAAELLLDERYNLPARVLISACASAGAEMPEWLGLGPAALWAGAEEVIVTAWPTLDHPITAELDARLIRILCEEEDVAYALRDLQLEELSLWRARDSCQPLSAGSDLEPELPNSPRFNREFRAPYFWAPYVLLGFTRTAGLLGLIHRDLDLELEAIYEQNAQQAGRPPSALWRSP
jgi:tetratricopeptide (TPR) repeat protein